MRLQYTHEGTYQLWVVLDLSVARANDLSLLLKEEHSVTKVNGCQYKVLKLSELIGAKLPEAFLLLPLIKIELFEYDCTHHLVLHLIRIDCCSGNNLMQASEEGLRLLRSKDLECGLRLISKVIICFFKVDK